jgi:hypothetical protein
VCGNCTKAPTHDSRTPCCCGACGHCFKLPTYVYQYQPWYPYVTWGNANAAAASNVVTDAVTLTGTQFPAKGLLSG